VSAWGLDGSGNRVQGLLARVEDSLATERHLFGCSLLRIGLGCVVLYCLVGHWAQREFLWGPRGIYPLWLFYRELPRSREPSLFAVESELLFDALYVAAIGVALFYTLGWRTRWLGLPFYVFTWSLFTRNPQIPSGGETFLLVQLPYLLFANMSAYLSIDSGWRGVDDVRRPPRRPFAALLHNVALLCVLVQLCVVYAFTGIHKTVGSHWQDGTALYYVLRLDQFAGVPFSPLIYLNPPLVMLLTYATVAFEVSFPFLIWSRRTRWVAALGAVMLHAGIAAFMGLVLFAVEMLIFQFIVFDDRSYLAGYRRWLRLRERVRRLVEARPRLRAAREPPEGAGAPAVGDPS
jgi:hypothetical protein